MVYSLREFLISLFEKGLEFDTCFGVSAGACMACSYLSKQKGRGYHTFTDYMDNRNTVE